MSTRKTIRCTIRFDSYIADPYWPEKDRVVTIDLQSGVNRLKIESKKEAAIKSQCQKEGITVEDYKEFIVKAARQWNRIDDDDPNSPIVISRHKLAGCLVETIGRTPTAVHGKYNTDSFRHHVRISDFVTDRTKKDSVFDRYVKLENSNKRDRQRNEAIEEFTAKGTFSVAEDTKLEDLRRLVEYAVCEIGVGASRKMGYGFGEIAEFEEE